MSQIFSLVSLGLFLLSLFFLFYFVLLLPSFVTYESWIVFFMNQNHVKHIVLMSDIDRTSLNFRKWIEHFLFFFIRIMTVWYWPVRLQMYSLKKKKDNFLAVFFPLHLLTENEFCSARCHYWRKMDVEEWQLARNDLLAYVFQTCCTHKWESISLGLFHYSFSDYLN